MAKSSSRYLTRRALMTGAPAAAFGQTSNLAADPLRPVYHFLPPANWMNDPNGPIYWRGKYHMFYQHNPQSPSWGLMHWGHAVSTDMIHWRHLPVALAPGPGGYDRNGVYGGCTVDDNGVPTTIYTGARPEVQCLATSKDGGYTWTKESRNPVLADPPAGMQVTGFRDPYVWRDGEAWYMALGSGELEQGGMVLLYRSPDLVRWNYLRPLYRGKLEGKSNPKTPAASGELWESPCFFQLGGKHVLFFSTQGTAPVHIGSYADDRFQPEWSGRLDCGDYYGPATQLDESGRRILWGWIQERRSAEAQSSAGWSGVLSLPRLLSLRPDNTLGIEPAPQCRVLRGARQQFVNIAVPANRPIRVPGLAGDALELIAEFDTGNAEEIGLRVLEDVPVLYDLPKKRLSVGAPRSEATGQFVLEENEPLRLHIFVDCSVIEVFFNGRACYTGRAYPESVQRLGVWLVARGGSARLRSLSIYEMQPISNNRMTS